MVPQTYISSIATAPFRWMWPSWQLDRAVLGGRGGRRLNWNLSILLKRQKVKREGNFPVLHFGRLCYQVAAGLKALLRKKTKVGSINIDTLLKVRIFVLHSDSQHFRHTFVALPFSFFCAGVQGISRLANHKRYVRRCSQRLAGGAGWFQITKVKKER